MQPYSKDKFLEALDRVNECRFKILDMYNDTLYADDWDEHTVRAFSEALDEYSRNVELIQEWLPSINWTDLQKRDAFLKRFKETLLDDKFSYNLLKVRHDAYLVYRTNRKSLISQLNDVVGFVKQKANKNNKEVFNWFNDRCAKIPMYDNKNSDGQVTVNKYPVLRDWFLSNRVNITDEINDDMKIESHYEQSECLQIFKKYVQCRQAVFNIFNMITSKSNINGYQKWHNVLDAFCEADIKDIQLEKLYNAANSENDFITTDDYQQEMDDKSWNLKGIYESKDWWEIDWRVKCAGDPEKRISYKRMKQDIQGINMVNDQANVCKIIHNGKAVFAGANFYPNDIIEICPTKNIDKTSLYTKDMRDIVFEVKPNEEWVLPFGYCQYYDIDNTGDTANCTFLWDPITRNIVIKALRNIKKHEKLILKTIN